MVRDEDLCVCERKERGMNHVYLMNMSERTY